MPLSTALAANLATPELSTIWGMSAVHSLEISLYVDGVDMGRAVRLKNW